MGLKWKWRWFNSGWTALSSLYEVMFCRRDGDDFTSNLTSRVINSLVMVQTDCKAQESAWHMMQTVDGVRLLLEWLDWLFYFLYFLRQIWSGCSKQNNMFVQCQSRIRPSLCGLWARLCALQLCFRHWSEQIITQMRWCHSVLQGHHVRVFCLYMNLNFCI